MMLSAGAGELQEHGRPPPSFGGSPPPDQPDLPRQRASASDQPLRTVIEEIVGDVFEVDPAHLRLPTRGQAKVALARQVAMYIAHVGYRLTLTEVGQLFERDRTTVSHACAVVELKRDDGVFDEAVILLDLIVRAMNGARRAGGAAQHLSMGGRGPTQKSRY